MGNKTVLALRMMAAAAVMGILGDLLLRQIPWGLNIFVWLAALVAIVLWLQRSAGDRVNRWMMAPVERGGSLWHLLRDHGAADMVADNGILVFAVCSLEPEEGAEQVAAFLERHPEFRRDPILSSELFGMSELIANGDLRTLPCHLSEQGGMDGFYAARLRRSV